jgi:hypothetical protein
MCRSEGLIRVSLSEALFLGQLHNPTLGCSKLTPSPRNLPHTSSEGYRPRACAIPASIYMKKWRCFLWMDKLLATSSGQRYTVRIERRLDAANMQRHTESDIELSMKISLPTNHLMYNCLLRPHGVYGLYDQASPCCSRLGSVPI